MTFSELFPHQTTSRCSSPYTNASIYLYVHIFKIFGSSARGINFCRYSCTPAYVDPNHLGPKTIMQYKRKILEPRIGQ